MAAALAWAVWQLAHRDHHPPSAAAGRGAWGAWQLAHWLWVPVWAWVDWVAWQLAQVVVPPGRCGAWQVAQSPPCGPLPAQV